MADTETLRQEIKLLLLIYDQGGQPEPYIKHWVRLINRERKAAVELAFQNLRHFLGADDLTIKSEQVVLNAMFPEEMVR